MKRNIFYKINTIDGDKYLDENYINILYDYYVTGSIIFKYEVVISEDEFNKLIRIIDDLLRTKLTDEEVKKALLQYIQLIISDSRNGIYVDINYFIKCSDYLALDILENKFLKKIRNDIKELKKNLTNEFVIGKSNKNALK